MRLEVSLLGEGDIEALVLEVDVDGVWLKVYDADRGPEDVPLVCGKVSRADLMALQEAFDQAEQAAEEFERFAQDEEG